MALTSDECHLRPVFRMQLFHDIAEMNLHRAFTHVEVVGDDFVGFTLAESFNDSGLAFSE